MASHPSARKQAEELPANFADKFAANFTEIAATRWQGHKGLFGRNERWTHPLIVGVTVRHCGHPTALRPYYVTVDGGGPLVLDGSLHGRTWPQLVLAQQAVLEALRAAIAPT